MGEGTHGPGYHRPRVRFVCGVGCQCGILKASCMRYGLDIMVEVLSRGQAGAIGE